MADPSKAPEREPRDWLGVFRYSRRAIELVWTTSRGLTIALALLTLVGGLLPAAAAWIGKHIVDAVLAAIDVRTSGLEPDLRPVIG